ncbi:complex I NDUFA9 subunit family protein [Deinococcus taklimakanensis]|uniref:Complex I NDUFA9 subunit family protein n=1 Tax=Deinococcus taklimakanensis TaxID=536443 RepID=A0ABW5P0C2_9DEIO
MIKVLVTGATGFVGRAITAEVQRRGHEVVAASRSGQAVAGAPGVKLDVTNAESTRRVFQDVQPDAVVHLVGIIQERGDQTFQRVHVDGTRNVLAATPRGARFIHMSALGAGEIPGSRYSVTKGEAEGLVERSGLAWTVFRPSLIFGVGDDFFGRVLKQLVSTGPVVPQIGDGGFPFRPVSVEDVAAAFAQALERPQTAGRAYALTGPEQFTFRQLLDLELSALGRKKPVVPVPLPLMDVAVPLMNLLPFAPITRDQYAMLKAGNTAPNDEAKAAFDLPMLCLQDRLPAIVRGRE